MSLEVVIKRTTVPLLKSRKNATPIVALTAYTTPMARFLDPHVDLTLYAGILGFLIGGSMGFGYGLAAAMDKHLKPIGYALSTALAGTIMCTLYTLAFESRAEYRGLALFFGLVMGSFGGLLIALIIRITHLHIHRRPYRQVCRLALSLVAGVLGGLLLVIK